MGGPQRKYSVGGLKLSEELIQIWFSPQGENRLEDMLRRLADRQVNVIGLTIDAVEGRIGGGGWIRSEDRKRAEEVLESFPGCFSQMDSVGLLTLFPVQSRSDLIRDVLSLWGETDLPLFHIAASPTSLILATDFRRLDEAVSVVCRVIALPENHAPFRAEYRVKQL